MNLNFIQGKCLHLHRVNEQKTQDIGSYITESPPRKMNEPITNAIRASRHVRRRFYDAFEVCGEPW